MLLNCLQNVPDDPLLKPVPAGFQQDLPPLVFATGKTFFQNSNRFIDVAGNSLVLLLMLSTLFLIGESYYRFVYDATDSFSQTRTSQRWFERHFEYTQSPKAEWVLENWDTMLPKFVKVFPHEYKRVLKEQAAAQEKAQV